MKKTRTITVTALFAAIATIVMYFEMPLPLMPPFLKVDLSGAVILIGAYLFGTRPAIFMAFIKDLFHGITATKTGYVGELADFLILVALILAARALFRHYYNRKGALLGCVAGTIAMTGIAVLANYFLLIPFYSNIMPLNAIWELCKAVNPLIVDLKTYLLFGVLPFNLIKGAILSLVTVILYERLEHGLRQKMEREDMDSHQ